MADQPPLELEADEAAPPKLTDVPVLLFIRGLAAVLVLLSLIVGAHAYIAQRLLGATGVAEPWSSLGRALVWVGFGSIFLGFIGQRTLPRPLAKVVQWVGFGWMGAFGLLLAGTVVADLAVFAAGLAGVAASAARPVATLGVLALVVPALVWGFLVARRPRVKRVELPIAGLAKAFDGYRVVQLSDVHIGETLGREFAAWLAAKVNGLSPDLVVITGDMVDGSVARLRDEVAPLGDLRAKDGVLYVTGNHEYYHGGEAWSAHARRLGLTPLHNEHRVVRRGEAALVVGGVPDVEGARFSQEHVPDAAKAFAGAPAGAPRLLLAHQPRFAKHAQGQGVSLMLSGHTHGGQIFPFMFFVRLQQPVIAGLRELWGVRTYTSRGTGYWGPPFRVFAPGEVTELVLRAA